MAESWAGPMSSGPRPTSTMVAILRALLDHIAQVVLATETPWSDLCGVKDTRFGFVADLHIVDAALNECVEDAANHPVVEVPLVADAAVSDGAVEDLDASAPVGHETVWATFDAGVESPWDLL